jgi:hypothetical protein
MEAIVATVIAVIAVMALAYSFGFGRGFINNFETRRAADAVAQGCMERLGTLQPTAADLTPGGHPPTPPVFAVNGQALGTITWRVGAPSDVPSNVAGVLREVTVTVAWAQGGQRDSVNYTRLVAAP